MHLGLRPQLQHPELASGEPTHVRGSPVGAQMPNGKPHTHQDITSYPVPAAALPRGPPCPPWLRGMLARHGAIALRRLAHTITRMTTTSTSTLMLNTGAAARTCDNAHNAPPFAHAGRSQRERWTGERPSGEDTRLVAHKSVQTHAHAHARTQPACIASGDPPALPHIRTTRISHPTPTHNCM